MSVSSIIIPSTGKIAPQYIDGSLFGSTGATAVSQTTGVNPVTSISNGTYDASNSPLYLCVNGGGNYYWIRLSGSSNYNNSSYVGPALQDCGS